MSCFIQVRPEVESDIHEAAAWYEGKQPGLGVEFEEEIAARINWLYENALLPRVRHRIWNIRWVYPERFPYRIIYRVEEDSVLIIAILHSARRERHWRSRMRT